MVFLLANSTSLVFLKIVLDTNYYSGIDGCPN